MQRIFKTSPKILYAWGIVDFTCLVIVSFLGALKVSPVIGNIAIIVFNLVLILSIILSFRGVIKNKDSRQSGILVVIVIELLFLMLFLPMAFRIMGLLN